MYHHWYYAMIQTGGKYDDQKEAGFADPNCHRHYFTHFVESELSTDELLAYYGSRFEYIEVRKQTSADIDFVNAGHCRFDGYIDGKTYYSVICWDDNRRELLGDFIGGLLDLDIRGH